MTWSQTNLNMDFIIILNLVSQKKSWNWVLPVLQPSLNLIPRKNSWNQIKHSYLKLFSWKKSWNHVLQLSLNLISRKKSWNQVKQLYLKLFSRKNSWNQVLQLSLNLITRKNSRNQVKQLTWGLFHVKFVNKSFYIFICEPKKLGNWKINGWVWAFY